MSFPPLKKSIEVNNSTKRKSLEASSVEQSLNDIQRPHKPVGKCSVRYINVQDPRVVTPRIARNHTIDGIGDNQFRRMVASKKSSYPIIHSSATEFDAFDPSTVVLELDQAQPDSRFTRTEKWMNESKDTDQDMHYTPGIDSASITKILLDQWIQEYEREQWNFNSIAIYGEVKLREAFHLTAPLGLHNGFIACLSCDLLEKMAPSFGVYAPLFGLLCKDIFRSIFLNYDDIEPKGGVSFFGGILYFQEVHVVKNEIRAIRLRRQALLKANEGIQEEMLRCKYVLGTAIKNWQRNLRGNSFRQWMNYVAMRKRLKKLSKMCVENAILGRHRQSLFVRWKIFTEISKKEKVDEQKMSRIRALQKRKDLIDAKKEAVLELEEKKMNLSNEIVELNKKKMAAENQLKQAKKRLEDDREEEILERACNWILRIGHPVIVSIIDAAISRLEYLSLFAPPNLSDLLESFDQSNIPTMELLRRWINLLLSRCEVNRKWNLESTVIELQDCAILLHVLKHLYPEHVDLHCLNFNDLQSRAIQVTDVSKNILFLPDLLPILSPYHSVQKKSAAWIDSAIIGDDQVEQEPVIEESKQIEEMPTDPLQPILHDYSMLGAAFVTPKDILEAREPVLSSYLSLLLMQKPFPHFDPEHSFQSLHAISRSEACTENEDQFFFNHMESLTQTPTSLEDLRIKVLDAQFSNRDIDIGGELTIPDSHQEKEHIVDQMTSEDLDNLCKQFFVMHNGLDEAESKMNYAKSLWHITQSELESKIWSDLGICCPHDNLDDDLPERVAAEASVYLELDENRLRDLLQSENDFESQVRVLRDITTEHAVGLQQIYRMYSGSGYMDRNEFWKFVKDCKIPSKSLTLQKIGLIFERSNLSESETKDQSLNYELLPSEFLESLIRIANTKYSKRSSISERFTELLNNNIFPHAKRMDMDYFHGLLQTEKYKSVIQTYANRLRADVNSREGAAGLSTMNEREFLLFCKDYELITPRFSNRDASNIFTSVQTESEDKQEEKEMVLSEYLDALCAVAAFRNPDPFVPLHIRIDHFLASLVDFRPK